MCSTSSSRTAPSRLAALPIAESALCTYIDRADDIGAAFAESRPESFSAVVLPVYNEDLASPKGLDTDECLTDRIADLRFSSTHERNLILAA